MEVRTSSSYFCQTRVSDGAVTNTSIEVERSEPRKSSAAKHDQHFCFRHARRQHQLLHLRRGEPHQPAGLHTTTMFHLNQAWITHPDCFCFRWNACTIQRAVVAHEKSTIPAVMSSYKKCKTLAAQLALCGRNVLHPQWCDVRSHHQAVHLQPVASFHVAYCRQRVPLKDLLLFRQHLFACE